MQHIDPVAIWRQLLSGSGKSWVVFENGTCVIVDAPTPDVAGQAQHLLREWGPVRPGGQGGDFGVRALKGHLGWIVTGHHHAIGTFVAHDEVEPHAHEVEIGLRGRSKRGMDADALRVLHVELTHEEAGLGTEVGRRWTPWRALTKWRASRPARRDRA
jgi:hypothetical protein